MFEDLRGQYFPLELPGGVICHPVTAATCTEVRQALMAQVFPHWEAMNRYEPPAERRANFARLREIYQHVHREYFVFYDRERPVGWSMGRMENVITYRMNNTGVLPQYRRKGIYRAFLTHLLAYIKALGYETVISYHHPTNRAILQAKLSMGFVISGTILSEEVGVTIQLSHYFYEDRLAAFEEALSLEPDFSRQTGSGGETA
jgi:GNAT superfamily N-acetyltransferase